MTGRNDRELKERAEPAKVVGLTGGIASGKTVATDALREAGFFVIDADEVSRALSAPGTACERELVAMFPAAADGVRLNRHALRDIIAADKSARDKLNGYMHPLIISEIKNSLGAVYPAVLSAPLLFETGLASLCDCTVCVTAPRDVRIARITARDGVSEQSAAAMIDAQMPDCVRATLADYCVPSDTGKSAFTKEITELVRALTGA